jgi:hypothetical protein
MILEPLDQLDPVDLAGPFAVQRADLVMHGTHLLGRTSLEQACYQVVLLGVYDAMQFSAGGCQCNREVACWFYHDAMVVLGE